MTDAEFISEPAGQRPDRRARRRGGGRRRPGRHRRGGGRGAQRRSASRLLERYPYLGGLASGGMVLVLDDMCNGAEITVRGICQEMIERMERHGLAVYPPEAERGHDPAACAANGRAGALFDFNTRTPKPHPIVLRRRLRSRRLEARLQRHGAARPASICACTAGSRRAIVEDGAHQGRRLRDQGRPPGDPGQRW